MSERVLIIGGGGREHSLAWKLAQSPHVDEITVAPGNAGTLGYENAPIEPTDVEGLVEFALKREISLTVVGPDESLAAGVVDAFQAAKLPIFGPTREAAKLESSKVFAYNFMRRHNIPTFFSSSFVDFFSAKKYLRARPWHQVVVKADGLARGQGVTVPTSARKAEKALYRNLVEKQFGTASETVLIQDRGEGPELSVFALCDGERAILLPFCRDYKRLKDGNKGRNTGGMGAFGPVDVEPRLAEAIKRDIIRPTIDGMNQEGHPYRGILYVGLMLSDEGPKVIEYNARFGDPECQALMLLIDEDIYPRLRQAAKGVLNTEPIKVRPGFAVTVALAAKGYPGTYETGQEIFGLDDLPEGVQVFHAGTSKLEGDGRIVTDGGRVLHVVSYNERLAIAQKQVYSAIGEQAIHFAGMQYRKDIADLA